MDFNILGVLNRLLDYKFTDPRVPGKGFNRTDELFSMYGHQHGKLKTSSYWQYYDHFFVGKAYAYHGYQNVWVGMQPPRANPIMARRGYCAINSIQNQHDHSMLSAATHLLNRPASELGLSSTLWGQYPQLRRKHRFSPNVGYEVAFIRWCLPALKFDENLGAVKDQYVLDFIVAMMDPLQKTHLLREFHKALQPYLQQCLKLRRKTRGLP